MKKTIATKIVCSYVIIVVVSLLFMGTLFNISIKKYMQDDIMDELRAESRIVIHMFKNEIRTREDINRSQLRNLILQRIQMSRLGLESQFKILIENARGQINVLSSSNDSNSIISNDTLKKIEIHIKKSKFKNFTIRINGEKYLATAVPIPKGNDTPFKAWVFLYISTEQINMISREIFSVLVTSMVVVGAIAIVFGVIFAKSIAKPIIQLKKRTELLAKRDFDATVDIHTGDELEELGDTINQMAIELKEYDVSQKRFMQNASHELKTPLMSIQGYAEAIKDGIFEDNVNALNIIVAESKRLKKIVEEIIFLSKLESLESFYNFKKASMNAIIIQSLEKVNGLAMQNDINLHFIPNQDIHIYMDEDKMVQAFINILGNCIRYADKEVHVAITVENNSIKVIINDDGNGFKNEDMTRIFERFYKGRKGDTGLGMAITKTIVEKHGGYIEAHNRNTEGAEFVVILPTELI